MKLYNNHYTTLFIFLFILGFYSCKKDLRPLELSSLFSDHMVLQQDTEILMWGTYIPGKEVSIHPSWDKENSTKVSNDGKWKVKFSTPVAGGPFSIEIKTRNDLIQIEDVMIGEVWLASGQSNMEMPLKGWPPNDPIKDSENVIKNANYPSIRMLTVKRNLSTDPLDSITGKWEITTPENAQDFSASAYFFARRLYKELQIPIGIIHSSWGGTPAEAWTSNEQLRSIGEFSEILDQIGDKEAFKATKDWFAKWNTVDFPGDEKDWETLSFHDEQLAKQEFDDQAWTTIELPGRFDRLEKGQLDGAFWLRKNFILEDPGAAYTLSMGPIDDMDDTYINGIRIGGLTGDGKYNISREYEVPSTVLQAGENTIAIRAIDTGGPGSIGSPIVLSDKKGIEISLDGLWKYMSIAEIYEGKFHVYSADQAGFPSRPEIFSANPYQPSVLFNAMIHPLIPYSIKGALWYQGESNVGRAAQYQKLFPAMIKDWRNRWEVEFPFYFVQIAPFYYNRSNDGSPDVSQELREAQRLSLTIPKSGMVVTMDIGNFTNIHPANKQDVGSRLAGLALSNDYAKDIVASGPIFKSSARKGNKLILSFDSAGSGLMTNGETLEGVEIAGSDRKFVSATANIIGDQVEVFNRNISNPVHARYAWNDKGIASLFNKEGLPASSFSTESE